MARLAHMRWYNWRRRQHHVFSQSGLPTLSTRQKKRNLCWQVCVLATFCYVSCFRVCLLTKKNSKLFKSTHGPWPSILFHFTADLSQQADRRQARQSLDLPKRRRRNKNSCFWLAITSCNFPKPSRSCGLTTYNCSVCVCQMFFRDATKLASVWHASCRCKLGYFSKSRANHSQKNVAN